MLYFSDISLIFQLCLYYLAIYTYKAKLKKKYTHFYSEISIFNYFPLQKILCKRFFIDGKVPLVLGWLVGWSVCGCLPLYINTWWSDLSPLHPCMHRYSEGELDSLVSVTLGKPWFVTDRHLMLQTWLFCVLAFWQLYIP